MQLNYKISESNEKPLEIDVTSSSSGVYIRRNIKELEREEGGSKYFQYEEAFITKSEYEQVSKDLLIGQINGEENSAAYERYKNKLDTPIEYPTNGFTYKPKWAENIYAGLIEKGKLLPTLFPLTIYDSTEKAERAQSMSMEDLVALSVFLAQKQEEFFAEYKREKAGII